MSQASPGPEATGRPTWVVMPALDEELHIAQSLRALATAADQAPGPVHVIVVDDGSTDATAALAHAALSALPGHHRVVPGPGRGVGPARRLGLELALASARAHAEWGGDEVPDALIASTDADTQVAPSWLARMHHLLDEGHVVIAGDIHLERSTDPRLAAARTERLAARLAALPAPESPAPHPHFAAASLGFAAAALARLEPLPSPRNLEDRALLERCRERGVPVLRDHTVLVITSGRTFGRAAQGLADALAADLALLEVRSAEAAEPAGGPG